MICSKCEWDGRVQAGEFKDRPWEETPCARCEFEEDSTWTFEYDDDRPPLEEGCAGGTADVGDPLVPASVLADALRLFLSLPRDALDVIHLRFGGMPYREIAEKLGVGVAAVEVRHKRALEKVPALKALFPKKIGKQAARIRSAADKAKKPMSDAA
jgi:DNA-directed RNA polymerase specialized sigma24 family protein